jgi:AAA+ ATPase superfamily predicted ATPase
MNIIGRKKEIEQLQSLYKSDKSDFLVVYGRRRIGKTFLIREVFKEKFAFQHTALANEDLQSQLMNFNFSLQNQFNSKIESPKPSNWLEAFQFLAAHLEKSKAKRKLIFIDELPWLNTPKSGFLSAFEHFWNAWASAREDVFLIVCGSAASWMVSKIVKNKGGLHNRITARIHLRPFNLSACEALAKKQGIQWNKHQLMEMYMALGGIPYYWSLIPKGISAAQAIDHLFFENSALLKDEMQNLYASLFKNHEGHETIVKTLATSRTGLTREKLISKSKLPNGGGTTKILNELEQSDFMRKYTPIGRQSRESIYQLTDFFTLFFFNFIHKKGAKGANSWMNQIDHSAHRAWSGYAFELLCLLHVEQIKLALGISGIDVNIASWRSKSDKPKQIDLLLERRDQVINVCEIKFSMAPYLIDKKYHQELLEKIAVLKSETKTRHAVHLTFISPYGLKQNSHSGITQQDLKADMLFED